MITELDRLRAVNTQLQEALADLLDRIRCTGLDMGGRHRYTLLGNGGTDLPVVIQRAGDAIGALDATPPAAFALPPADDDASAEADRFTADYYAKMGKRIVRPATPPAAEPAGPIHAPRCPACFRTGYTINGRFGCDHCNGTPETQP